MASCLSDCLSLENPGTCRASGRASECGAGGLVRPPRSISRIEMRPHQLGRSQEQEERDLALSDFYPIVKFHFITTI